MYLIYVDDSGDEHLSVFSALAIPIAQWHACFGRVRNFRRELKSRDGIYVYKELHAWKFVSGRGRPSSRVVAKAERAAVFREAIRLVADLPGVRLFNAVFPQGRGLQAFEQLLIQIDRVLTAWDGYGIIISDTGKEGIYTRLMRKMYVSRPIPILHGPWSEAGEAWRNLRLQWLVEDPFLRILHSRILSS